MPDVYAEVIGDPVAHSLSPAIHTSWIAALGLDARYQATGVTPEGLAPFLAGRRADPDWRGCNVTAPHKVAVAALMDRLTPAAERIGAVNCVFRDRGALVGDNTDIAGVAAALGSAEIAGRKTVILGAGGAAAPAVDHLLEQGAAEIVLLVRDSDRAALLCRRAPDRVRAAPFAGEDIAGTSVVINATPLGLQGGMPMPAAILAALPSAAPGATVLDMVYRPERTPLLAAAEAAGLRAVRGMVMLIGQARPSFALFFGRPAPV
jgi:shikimate dehydrogenase